MAVHDFNDLEKNVHAARVEVLMTDIAAGLTFVHLALEASADAAKRRRNRANARKAYDSVIRFSKSVTFTPREEEALNNGLAKLKSALEQLGESFDSGADSTAEAQR